MKTALAFLSLTAIGFLIAFATAAASGKVEAWDAAGYWTLALPGSIVVAGIAGYLIPAAFPLWGIAVMAGHWIQAAFASGELGSMWVVGLLFSLVLGLVCDAGAWVGATLRKRRSTMPGSTAAIPRGDRNPS